MNLLEAIMGAQGGGAVRQMGQNFGLGEDQTKSALSALLPALSSGLKRNTSSQDGLSGLLGALGSGKHDRYLDQPELLGQTSTRDEGNGILGHLLGSKDVSRQVASRASAQTGIGSDVLKQMLPVVATMVMGSLSKQTQGNSSFQGALGGKQAPDSGLMGMLGPMLDADGDGSVADDLLGMASKFF